MTISDVLQLTNSAKYLSRRFLLADCLVWSAPEYFSDWNSGWTFILTGLPDLGNDLFNIPIYDSHSMLVGYARYVAAIGWSDRNNWPTQAHRRLHLECHVAAFRYRWAGDHQNNLSKTDTFLDLCFQP